MPFKKNYWDLKLIILSGSDTEPLLLSSPLLILSTNSMPSNTFPNTVYCLSRKGAGLKHMKNWLFALSGSEDLARSSDPDSANSQFFICFKPAPFLDRQYTVFGKVLEGMEFVDKIKRGDDSNNGSVSDPDKIISFKSQ